MAKEAKFVENSVVAAALKVVEAKKMGVSLSDLKDKTAVDFSQVTLPVGTKVTIPEKSEIDNFLYNDKSVLAGTTYDVFGIVCPVVDASNNVIATKRVALRSFEREMPVYAMVDGVPQATAVTKGGDTELARTLRAKEVLADKVEFLCGKTLEVVREEVVPSPRYTQGIVTGIRDRKIPVWDVVK
jgi:hypothetical protein